MTSVPGRLRRSIACLVAVLAGSPAAARAGPLAYAGSIQYATGSYVFTPRTRSVSVTNGLTLSTGSWRAFLSVPVIAQRTPPAVALPAPSGGTGGDDHDTHHLPEAAPVTTMAAHELGLGDALLRVDREWLGMRGHRPSVRLVAAGKAPLSRGHAEFGTGEWDVGGGLGLAQRLGRTFLFLDATYWRLGDPDGIDLHNAFEYGFAVGRSLASGRLSALASVAGFTSIVDGVAAPAQVGLAISYRTNSGRAVSGNASIGLTDSASDFGLGIGWRLGI